MARGMKTDTHDYDGSTTDGSFSTIKTLMIKSSMPIYSPMLKEAKGTPKKPNLYAYVYPFPFLSVPPHPLEDQW